MSKQITDEDRENVAPLLNLVKLAAEHVWLGKLLAAPQPTSMPPAFAAALRELRQLVGTVE